MSCLLLSLQCVYYSPSLFLILPSCFLFLCRRSSWFVMGLMSYGSHGSVSSNNPPSFSFAFSLSSLHFVTVFLSLLPLSFSLFCFSFLPLSSFIFFPCTSSHCLSKSSVLPSPPQKDEGTLAADFDSSPFSLATAHQPSILKLMHGLAGCCSSKL